MSDPVRLELRREPARFDPARLEDLCRLKGEARAEEEAAEALSRIGRLLQDIAPVARGTGQAVPRGRLARRIDALIAASDVIGMATLARVARDVRACLDAGDAAALGATLARLVRVGDRSIHAVFDLDDQIV